MVHFRSQVDRMDLHSFVLIWVKQKWHWGTTTPTLVNRTFQPGSTSQDLSLEGRKAVSSSVWVDPKRRMSKVPRAKTCKDQDPCRSPPKHVSDYGGGSIFYFFLCHVLSTVFLLVPCWNCLLHYEKDSGQQRFDTDSNMAIDRGMPTRPHYYNYKHGISLHGPPI